MVNGQRPMVNGQWSTVNGQRSTVDGQRSNLKRRTRARGVAFELTIHGSPLIPPRFAVLIGRGVVPGGGAEGKEVHLFRRQLPGSRRAFPSVQVLVLVVAAYAMRGTEMDSGTEIGSEPVLR
eukprot:2945445-Rhodomonas_salina.3